MTAMSYPCIHLTPRPALLDSGLRRNDDSGKNDGGGKINALIGPE